MRGHTKVPSEGYSLFPNFLKERLREGKFTNQMPLFLFAQSFLKVIDENKMFSESS